MILRYFLPRLQRADVLGLPDLRRGLRGDGADRLLDGNGLIWTDNRIVDDAA